MSDTWEMEDTVVLLRPEMRKKSQLAHGTGGVPLIIESRADHVLVVCGAYGGKGRTVKEAMDALAKRMPRR